MTYQLTQEELDQDYEESLQEYYRGGIFELPDNEEHIAIAKETIETTKTDQLVIYAALDRAFKTFETFNEIFLEQPEILAYKDVWQQAAKASHEMYNLYQMLGSKFFDLKESSE